MLRYSKLIEERLQEKSEECEWKICGDKIHIYAKGIPGHIAFPEQTQMQLLFLQNLYWKEIYLFQIKIEKL